MKEDILGDLVGDIEWFLDEVGGQLELVKDLRTFVVLLEYYVVYLFRPEEQLVKLENIHPTNVQELLVALGVVRVEADPLEFDDGVGIHPLGRDLGVQAELLDLNWSKLIQIFSCA